MLEDLARQIEQSQITAGDSVDVVFDTEGGHVDVAFSIADTFCAMQDEGIQLRAVADNKVWSSGIVPFLACNIRVARPGSSFLVHQVKINTQTEATFGKADLDSMLQEIDNYAELLNEYYESYDIAPEVRSHLLEGDDLKISEPAQMIASGFVQAISQDLPKATGNYLNRFWEWCFPPAPSFAFINKSSTITTQTMTRNQVENIVRNELAGMLPDAIAQAVRLVNQQIEEPEPEEITNEGEALSAEELQKLTGVLYKTAAEVEGSPEVKYLAHPGKDVEKDHFVIPVKEDGEVEHLSAGDHKTKIDGSDFVIHSTGEDWYLHGKDVENQQDETDAPDIVPENEDDPEEKPEEVNLKPCNSGKKTKAPVNRSAPITLPSKAVERLYNQAAAYGPGCVGAQKR